MNPIKGMVAITSNYGIGKTTFALECGYHPKEITFINDDVKETGFEHKEFNAYVDLVGLSSGMTILEFHHKCLEIIGELKKSKVIIWDTWTQFQQSFPVQVKANPGDFRKPGEYSSMGKIKAGEIYQDAYRYEGAILSALKTKCDLLILTFHLKQEYINNVAIPGKFKPGHDRAIEKYADLRIWLTPNSDSQVPTGLVMKNIARRTIIDNSIKTQQVLPLKIDVCNWHNILHYWENPIGDRMPGDDEKPSRFELSLIEGSLTPEDKRMYEASVEIIEAQNKAETQEQSEAIKEFIVSLDTQSPPAIMAQVNEAIDQGKLEYNGQLTIGEVSKLIK